jgi:hypothetical protein
VLEKELSVADRLQLAGALAYIVKILSIIDLDPAIELLPMQKEDLKLLIQVDWLLPG